MNKKKTMPLIIPIILLLTFAAFTFAVSTVDKAAIGPKGSVVGFSKINGLFHSLTGTNMLLYTITDWLSLAALFIAFGFGVLGLVQLIKRKSLFKVDGEIILLGVFYILVIAVYVFFEFTVINYRPVLIGGHLEASYPSSTAMLIMCVMPTAAMQFDRLVKNKSLVKIINLIIYAFTAFMVIGRLISGVHWLTDILGGALLSAGLVTLYMWSIEKLKK